MFMAAHEGEYAVKRMCKVLRVQRSGYYAWRKRKPSTREQANQVLLGLIAVMPMLGHASWHAYRDLVDASSLPERDLTAPVRQGGDAS